MGEAEIVEEDEVAVDDDDDDDEILVDALPGTVGETDDGDTVVVTTLVDAETAALPVGADKDAALIMFSSQRQSAFMAPFRNDFKLLLLPALVLALLALPAVLLLPVEEVVIAFTTEFASLEEFPLLVLLSDESMVVEPVAVEVEVTEALTLF